MNLHENKSTFEQYIAATADYMGIANTDIVEKDYFVTYFLKMISAIQNNVIFKGGTSLSKCHKIIRRFSEDIDLNIDTDAAKLSQSQRKLLKQDIISLIDSAGFILENPELIRSRRDYNRYNINYGINEPGDGLKQHIIVETSVFIKSFPSEVMDAASIIYDFLVANNAINEIDQYALQPFKIKVQSIERTFIDKVFAISDYFMEGVTETHSRHIYDLYKIYPAISFDNKFTELVGEVRELRKPHKKSISAQEGVDIPELLRKIMSDAAFRSDYEQITSLLLFENVAYNEAVEVLDKIAVSGCF
ncbi:MAG: nucleotidyl transferase AbiEii/AbiGii toxin family protein [Oscillospiraceae bacterium]|nr:nucleotidyl transferase AbiEii/AbiGii toxin family protein [Oscillospiraceae bacterium]